MRRLVLCCINAALFIHMSSSAFIYDFVVMKKWNGSADSYFIGLSDFHDKKHRANDRQLEDLQSMFSKCQPESLRFAFEDVGSPGLNHDGQCGRFFVISNGGALNGFANICKRLQLNFNNFEYRYCRVSALGPVLNNLDSYLGKFASVKGTHVSAIISEVQKIIDELNNYNDFSILKKLYTEAAKRMNGLMKEMQLFRYADRTVEEYLTAVTTKENRLQLVKKLLTFDSVLFDLRVLHDVLRADKAASYVALAGGSHITRIAKLLAKFGYQYVQVENPRFVKEYNLGDCLGSHIVDGKYCERPEPIDLKVIADFL